MVQPINLQDSNISITVNLTPVPATPTNFGVVMLLVPPVLPGAVPFPGGVKTRTYTRATAAVELAADVTATYISAKMAADVLAAFAQTPHPSTIMLGRVTAWSASPTTVPADLAAIRAENDSWYCAVPYFAGEVVTTIKEDNITALGAYFAALKKVCIADTEDPECYAVTTADVMSKEATLAHERISIIFSQLTGATPGTLEQPTALCAACRWLAFDPDLISAPYRAQVTGLDRAKITATQLDLSSAQIGYIKCTTTPKKNGNCLQVYGSAPAFLDPGVNSNGRAVEEVLSADWLEARVRERLADLAVAVANRGGKIGLDSTGAAMIAAEINVVLQQGVAAGHWTGPLLGAATINTSTKTITFAAASVTMTRNALSFGLTVDFN